MRYLWVGLGWMCVGLGIAGAFVPLLPTTPFLLLAAFAFSRGSDRLHLWLMQHPQLGPPIHHWRTHRAISRNVKVYATLSIVVVFILSIVAGAPGWALIPQGFILAGVTCFLWTRGEPPRNDTQDSI